MDAMVLAVREFLGQALREAGDAAPLRDGDALFSSGRLDSLALTQLVLFLEDRCQVDFGALDFSADLVDSVEAIGALLQSQTAPER